MDDVTRGPTGSPTTRLIVIRGNSGSGKSALAAAVRSARPPRSVAIIGQDVIRREILGTGDDRDDHPVGLIDLTARYTLSRGFDVIIEGILNATVYQDSLRRLAREHRGGSPAATCSTSVSTRR